MGQKKTIGMTWGEKLEAREAAAKREAADIPRKEAEAIISKIEVRVAEAEGSGASCISLFGPITYMDVAGEKPTRVEELFRQHNAENRPLHEEDLAGKARLVLQACEAEGLECFLHQEQGAERKNDYMFYIRPKRG